MKKIGKTMTQEEKAKAYDKALEKAKKIHEKTPDSVLGLTLAGIFSELKESEDEKIRTFLIEFIKVCKWTEKKDQGWPLREDVLAWLEKQKDHEVELDKAYKTADEVMYRRGYEDAKRELEMQNEKSKFNVDDWIIDKQGIVHQIERVVENVTNHTFGYDIVGGGYFNDSTKGVRPWTIQDAKDGDVLESFRLSYC